MQYIEAELEKRRHLIEDSDVLPNADQDISPRPEKEESVIKKGQEKISYSAAMLMAIPEVDLGINVRLKNIEETEKAKKKLEAQTKQQPTLANPDDNFFAANQYKPLIMTY